MYGDAAGGGDVGVTAADARRTPPLSEITIPLWTVPLPSVSAYGVVRRRKRCNEFHGK